MIDTPVSAHAPTSHTWPAQKVVARMMGSLPMGGVVPETLIHTFAQPPECLRFQTQPNLQPSRRDIELGGLLAFVIDDVTTAVEADAIVAASEVFGYRDEAPGISTPPGMRMNKSVHWLADEDLLGPIMARIQALLPQRIDGADLYPMLSHRINMYRYDDQDIFNRHTDGDWPGYGLDRERQVMHEWSGLRSALTMLLYLNDASEGVQGGHTRLLARDGRWVDVAPRKGSALFFRHGFVPDSVIHIGDRVHGAVPKYVARINVMYEA